ncbi:hypothetical protein [Streptomyces sp. NPDC048282]|uniref:hypothetical protein n=1 Tax=Streptomyces sp. NPDC048282 TaxID=3365528 RepID=UPI003720ED78
MHTTLTSGTNYAVPFLIISIPFGVVSLLFMPQQLRYLRLRRHRVKTLAVCAERIRRGGTAVERLNCTFRTADGEEFWILITAPKPPPREGEEVPVVHEERKPSSAESVQYLASFGSRAGIVVQSLLTPLIVAAAAAGALS